MDAEARFYPWQQSQQERLIGLYHAGKLPHALLLSGPAWLGKRDFAHALASILLCRRPLAGAPCGDCTGCNLIKAGTHPDFRTLVPDAARKSRSIVIEQIRALTGWMSQTSVRGGLKLVIIHPAEQMNLHAANALLKCLEEPSDHTLIMLVSDLPGRLLPTIRSRCQSVNFTIPNRGDALAWLQDVEPDLQDPEVLLGFFGGAPLAVLHGHSDEFIALRANAAKVISRLIAGVNPLEMAEKLYKPDTARALKILHSLFLDAVRYALCNDDKYIKNSDMKDVIKVISSSLDKQTLLRVLDAIGREQAVLSSANNPNPQLLTEALLVELGGYCAL